MVAQDKSTEWPHQLRAVNEIQSFFRAGGQRLLMVCPTGGGKSRIGQRWDPNVVFVHTTELLKETRLKFPRAHCLTVQSSDRPIGSRILIDEAHHYKAQQFGRIFETYRGALFLGLTATPERGDGRPLDMFQGLIVVAHYSELLRAGFLVPCQTIHPADSSEGLSMDPVDAVLQYREQRRGFVFCSSKDQAADVAHRLRGAGVRAEAMASAWKKESALALQAFRAGHVDIIACVEMISEGIDVPDASFAVYARAIGTMGGYLQKVGRILRASPGKRNARFVDLVGAVFEHGLPTQDCKYSLDGTAIQRKESCSVSNCPKCGACYLPRATCPKCGFVAPVKPRQIKITPRDMIQGSRDPETMLSMLIQRRRDAGRHWYWVVAKYRDLFDSAPDLSKVPEDEKLAELDRLRAEGAAKGYKRGYAYARWNEIFNP